MKKSKKKQEFPTDDEIENYGEKSGKTEVKRSSTHEAKKPKKRNQYSNVRNMSQGKINAMFAEAYWNKKQKNPKKRK